MSLIHALILGIVEGITEFLPVSSTGHLIIASYLLKIPFTEFSKTFDIAIQVGAILAVPVYFGRRLFQDLTGNLELSKKVIYAFIPTAILGLVLYKGIKVLLGNILIVAIALILWGIALIVAERIYANRRKQDIAPSELTNGSAFMLGIFQALAFIPGISRSGAVISGGLYLDRNREKVVEFSFLLAFPTMLAATVLDIVKSSSILGVREYQLLFVGGAVSFIVSLICIKFLINFVKRHSLSVFGYYRIVLGIAILLFLALF